MTPVGSTWPSTWSYSAPTKYCGSSSGKRSRASLRADHLELHAEVAAAGDGHPQEVHPGLVAREHQAAGQVDRAVLAGLLLDLLVELDRVLLEPGDVRVAVERVHPAGRVPGRAGRQLAPLEEHDVGPAGLREVVEHAGADHAPTDHDHLGGRLHRAPSCIDPAPLRRRQSRGGASEPAGMPGVARGARPAADVSGQMQVTAPSGRVGGPNLGEAAAAHARHPSAKRAVDPERVTEWASRRPSLCIWPLWSPPVARLACPGNWPAIRGAERPCRPRSRSLVLSSRRSPTIRGPFEASAAADSPGCKFGHETAPQG